MTEQPVWTETDSRDFLDLAEIAVPARAEPTRAVLDLIPAAPEEAFTVAGLCAGEGLLCEALLSRFPRSRVVALDGPELMRRNAAARVADLGDGAPGVGFALAADD